MLTKLMLLPESTNYSVKNGSEVVSINLDGGVSRYRRDIVNAAKIVTCTWTLDEFQYSYFMAFYRGIAQRGSLPFLIDLIIDEPLLHEYTAYFVANTVSLTSHSGKSYSINASLEITSNTSDEYDSGRVTLYNLYGSYDKPNWINPLAVFANDTMAANLNV